MKKLYVSIALAGLITGPIVSNESPKEHGVFMGIFKIKDGPLNFKFNNFQKYQENSALWHAALKVCLAPAVSLSCLIGAGKSVSNGSMAKSATYGVLAIMTPLYLLADSCTELAFGNHGSIAYEAAKSDMAQSTIMNTYDLW